MGYATRVLSPRVYRFENQILVPELRADPEGFKFIADLSARLGKNSTYGNVNVDFREAVWVDAHMLAPLGAVLYSHIRIGHNVRLSNLQPKFEALARKNGFLSAFADEIRTRDVWGTTIPYRRYVPSDERSFPTYMARIAKSRGSLKFNDVAKNSLIMTTLELFNNSVSHGRSLLGVFVCGQYYPNANKLRFSMCDLGVGIRHNVSGFLMSSLDGVESIHWAMKRGNSTRVGRPGGMGLHFLQNFVESNGGKLTIVSGNAVVATGEEEYEMKTERYFQGTYVTLEVNTNIPSVYLSDYEEEGSDDLF